MFVGLDVPIAPWGHVCPFSIVGKGCSNRKDYSPGRALYRMSRMAKQAYYGLSAVLVVMLILGLAIYVGGITGTNRGGSSQQSIPGTSNSNSIQAGNQTYVAVYVNSLTTATSTTSGSTSGALQTQSTSTEGTATSLTSSPSELTSSSQTETTEETFAYSSSQVKILSVAATQYESGGNNTDLVLSVQFQNVGNGTIYVSAGAASSLNATIVSGAVEKVHSSVGCSMAIALVPVGPGEVHSSTAPTCEEGSYQVQGTGMVEFDLTLAWSGSNPGSIAFTAQFDIS